MARTRAAADAPALVRDDAAALLDAVGRDADDSVPPVAVARDERHDPLLALAADDDRRMGLLHVLRSERGLLEPIVLSGDGRVVLVPELGQHLEAFGEPARPLARRAERKAVRAVVALEPAGADAEHETAVAHVIDRRRHLREERGIPIRVSGH